MLNHKIMLNHKMIGRGSAAVLLAMGLTAAAQGAVIVSYDFGAGAGTNSATSNASNISFSDFTNSSGGVGNYVNGTSGKAMSDTGWPDSGTNYFQFSVTPAAGYRLDLSSLSFDHKTDNGSPSPKGGTISYSLGTPGTGTQAGTVTSSTSFQHNDISLAGVSSSSATYIRLVGTGATNSGKAWFVDNVTLNGEVTALAKMNASVSAAPSRAIVGTTVNVDLSVSNTATGGTRQDGLNFTAGASGDVSGSDNATGLAPGSPRVSTFSIDTSSAGAKTGDITVTSNNAYSTNGGVGQSTFSKTLNLDVLDSSHASFATGAPQDTLTLDFGTVTQNSAQSRSFSIANLESTAGYTAGLDLINFNLNGSGASQFSSDLATFTALAAGNHADFHVMLDTSTTGSFSALYTLTLGDDQTIFGATAGQILTLNLTGNVAAVPEPGVGLILLAGGMLGLMRRRARA